MSIVYVIGQTVWTICKCIFVIIATIKPTYLFIKLIVYILCSSSLNNKRLIQIIDKEKEEQENLIFND